MLQAQIREILQRQPEYAGITPVIEKEILHHDILHVMVEHGALHNLSFIGGTSLRLCYNSSRLSEDLDFNGGHDFNPDNFDGLESDIKNYIQKKYDTHVTVSKPNKDKQGDTKSWKISIERVPNRPDLPRQKMHIDICSIPSFDVKKRPLINHYGLGFSTEGILVPVQSLEETLADKFIALAYRARRIKPRDVWDIVWAHQQGVAVNTVLVEQKLEVRSKTRQDFASALQQQIGKLLSDKEVQADFYSEMSRFLPEKIKKRTLDNPEYWEYVTSQTNDLAKPLIQTTFNSKPRFDMGL